MGTSPSLSRPFQGDWGFSKRAGGKEAITLLTGGCLALQTPWLPQECGLRGVPHSAWEGARSVQFPDGREHATPSTAKLVRLCGFQHAERIGIQMLSELAIQDFRFTVSVYCHCYLVVLCSECDCCLVCVFS